MYNFNKYNDFFMSCLDNNVKNQYPDIKLLTTKTLGHLVKTHNHKKYLEWVILVLVENDNIDDLDDLTIHILYLYFWVDFNIYNSSKLRNIILYNNRNIKLSKDEISVKFYKFSNTDDFTQIMDIALENTNIRNINLKIHKIKNLIHKTKTVENFIQFFKSENKIIKYPLNKNLFGCKNGTLLLSSYRPEWTKQFYKCYPQNFKDTVITWLLICNRLGSKVINNDMRIMIIKTLADMNYFDYIHIRPTVSEDYINIGQPYVDYNFYNLQTNIINVSDEIIKVQKYLDQILPDKEIQNYMLCILARSLASNYNFSRRPIQIVGGNSTSKSTFENLISTTFGTGAGKFRFSGQCNYNEKLLYSNSNHNISLCCNNDNIDSGLIKAMAKKSQIIITSNKVLYTKSGSPIPNCTLIYFTSQFVNYNVSEKDHRYQEDINLYDNIKFMAPAFLYILTEKYKDYIKYGRMKIPKKIFRNGFKYHSYKLN